VRASVFWPKQAVWQFTRNQSASVIGYSPSSWKHLLIFMFRLNNGRPWTAKWKNDGQWSLTSTTAVPLFGMTVCPDDDAACMHTRLASVKPHASTRAYVHTHTHTPATWPQGPRCQTSPCASESSLPQCPGGPYRNALHVCAFCRALAQGRPAAQPRMKEDCIYICPCPNCSIANEHGAARKQSPDHMRGLLLQGEQVSFCVQGEAAAQNGAHGMHGAGLWSCMCIGI